MTDAPYREFPFPLNVFMHILTEREGEVASLHYGLFEHPDEPIAVAQNRATEMLLSRLPPPPARLLDVGSGVGSTLARLLSCGYAAVGITPDPQQVAVVRARYGNHLDVRQGTFENMPAEPFDCVLFQESSQYILSESLWPHVAGMTAHVVVFDEFRMQPVFDQGALHSLRAFLMSAEAEGFDVVENVDVSAMASPTMEYFARRIPEMRESLVRDLGVTDQQVDHLMESGATYRERYARGIYSYRILQFRKR